MHSSYHPPLIAVTQLFDALNAQGIRYCHWKSNCHLDRSISGLTDLDLLVDPAHGEHFRAILRQQDVKPMVSPPDKRYPAVEDYLGFDQVAGQLFHLHVHYQLILGEQFVKNYHLPLEQAFLDNVWTYQDLIKIPAPALELIVLAIRALLKYRDRDIVKDIFHVRSPGLPPDMLREFRYLLDQTDAETISNTLRSHVGFVRPEIIHRLLTTVVSSPRSGTVLFRLRTTLRRDLSAYQRHSRWRAMGKYWGALLRQRLSFLVPHPSKKTPATGGMLIAVIGADGAGKSTVVNAVRKWLSWKLEVRHHYIGSQEPSPISRLLRIGFRIASKLYRTWSELVGEKYAASRALHSLERLLHNLYYLSIARDRHRRYLVARQQATEGAIVICDRYPLAAIHRLMEGQPMDGPRIAADVGNEMDSITRRLAEIEQDIYQSIPPPDHIFVLHVSPDVSQQRKPEHDRKMIEAKSHALKHMDRQGLSLTEIDADQPVEQVLLHIKTALWQLL